MGLISKQLEVIGDKQKIKVQALFDTGASASFIRKNLADQIATVVRMPSPWMFILGDGKGRVQAEHCLHVDIIIKSIRIFHQLIAVKDLGEEMIIGADILQRWRIKLNPEREDILIDKRVTELKLM
jgi:hypothetical protein